MYRRVAALTILTVIAVVGCAGQQQQQLYYVAPPPPEPAAAAVAQPPPGSPPVPTPDPWPRKVTFLDATGVSTTLLVYQPQVESWEGNQIKFRAAVGARKDGSTAETFGVVWADARTEVNRAARMVTLADLNLTRSNFPTLPDNGAAYRQQLQSMFAGDARTIALDRLQASLAASGVRMPPGVAVKNDPPQVIVSYSPAILVHLSGTPVWRDVPGSRFERVINTRALILRQKRDATCYLHVYDGWLSAASVDGRWSQAANPPWRIEDVANRLVQKKLVDPLSGGNAQPPPSLANGVPMIYVSQKPAELIVFRGQPNLQPIAQTALLWAANTTADVIVDTATNFYYALISGRWYRASALSGPWSFVAGTNLPPEFSRIPVSSPAGVVLASVAGTPQAKEAVIANSIPQTGTIPRTGGPAFAPAFDGAPKFRPIEGTALQYVVNSPTPIMRVDAYTFYALQAGVWFTATSVNGPWAVAATVPAVIYTIPPSSPLYYVTFVRVYGSTPEAVYVGYTPGYLGTVVEPDGTVVYGTGYVYQPWVGTVYYPPPETYGMQAQPIYNPAVDMAYGMALGVTTAAMVDSWGSPAYYDSYYHGYPCCGSTSANVYGHYGSTAYSGTDTWYSHSSGNIGEAASGSYANTRTGTTGTYSGNRYVNPYDGDAGRGYTRTYDTAGGTTGSVSRGETYNAQTGQTSYGGSKTATTQGGSTVTRDTGATSGAQGAAAGRDTTVYNANTGQTKTYGSGYADGDHYASADGGSYRNDGSGWQKQTSSGWQSAGGEDTSWADREQQARSQAQSSFGSFSQGGGWADRSGGEGGSGGWAGRFGGGGGGGFGGDGGGWGSHFGGGGFGGRFGGGGGGRR
jgi:hypothetical protein